MKNFKYLFSYFIIITITIFISSCADEGNLSSNLNPCDNPTPAQIELPSANKFELTLEVCRALEKDHNITTEAQLLSQLFVDDNQLTAYKNQHNQERLSYHQVGFDNYITNKSNAGVISSAAKNYLISFKLDLLATLDTEPTLEEFKIFINAKRNEPNTLGLCPNELIFRNSILNGSEGFAQYYYKHFNIQSGSRSCNFFEALACGLLNFVATAAATLVTLNTAIGVNGAIAVHNTLFATTAKDNFEEYRWDLFLAAGTYVSNWIDSWCCGEEDPVLCAAPTGFFVQTHACNDFTYRVVGPSNYITTNWLNNNTNPASIITPTPSLRLSVPDLNNISLMKATIGCVDPNGTTTFDWNRSNLFNENANLAPPVITWGIPPPSNANVNTNYDVSVNTGSNGQMTLWWSVTPFGGIVSTTTANSGNLKFFSPGTRTVTATLTNTCTGQTATVSKIVNVN